MKDLMIIRRELSFRRNSIIIFCAIVFVLVVLYTFIFPVIQAQSAKFDQLISSLGSVYKAIGIQGRVSFNNLDSYMSTELFGFTWPLLASLFSLILAGTTVAGEIESGTLGMLLALPISRGRIFLVKFLAGLVFLVVFVIISTFSIIPLAEIIGVHFNITSYFLTALMATLFVISFFSLGLLVSATFSEKSHVYGVMGILLVVMYVANSLANLISSLSWLKYSSFFHYFDAQTLLVNHQLDLSSIILFCSVSILSLISGAQILRKRDIVI